MRPRLVDGIYVDDKNFQPSPPVEVCRVMSVKTARNLRNALFHVTDMDGTAKRARIEGYNVGGKTGTAHKLEGGVYAKKYIASFVGIAPISDPRLVVAVMIDEPSAGKYFGGLIAGPVFSGVMGGALRTLGVPPDEPVMQVVENSASGRERL